MSDCFDREWTLPELLPESEREKIGSALIALLGPTAALLDADGSVLWGKSPAAEARQPLVVELEPLGWVAAEAQPSALQAAATLVRQILLARSRYLLAAGMHTEAVNADYEALRASELRYKALSQALEERVREQVKQIDAQRRQLYEAEKFASVGQLAAGVAHEINNPIGFIRSNLNTLARYFSEFAPLKEAAPSVWEKSDLDFTSEDGRALIADCIDGADRIACIVGDLKGFSNIDSSAEDTVDLNDCLRHALAMLQMRLPANARLVLDLNPLPARRCYPAQLARAFLNVLNNACQFLPAEGGDIRVQTGLDGDAIIVRIADTGAGMTPEVRSRIFDPFFTTMPVGSGTGLGLTVARDVVVAHGGDIRVDSVSGRGTVITMRFP